MFRADSFVEHAVDGGFRLLWIALQPQIPDQSVSSPTVVVEPEMGLPVDRGYPPSFYSRFELGTGTNEVPHKIERNPHQRLCQRCN